MVYNTIYDGLVERRGGKGGGGGGFLSKNIFRIRGVS